MAPVKISYIDVVTPLGQGGETFYREVVRGESAISENTRFDCSAFRSDRAALVPGIEKNGKTCLVQMFDMLLERRGTAFPDHTRLIFAATVGEIDNLENSVFNDTAPGSNSTLLSTASRLSERLGLKPHPYVVSAACASASAAVDRARSLIQTGAEQSVLVASADCVSEFVFSGFSALMALDREPARPFDEHRDGLTAGEAAGFILLEAGSDPCEDGFYITGSGFSSDANHMTGPCRDGSGLAGAVGTALESAGLKPGSVDFIAAHGTGTRYNDAMEVKAYKSVFETPCPLFSLKGAVGHTMGNAGLLQICAAVEAMKSSTLPPSTGLSNADKEAAGWVTERLIHMDSKNALIVNAGFGGINGALVLTGRTCE
ncbi:MAG: beta-ketoacyl synthase N-terminal-like domain-containing protein [Desulfobacteraceae bacterium]